MKAELSRCNKLIDDGFSLIAVKEDKVPFGKWKDRQTIPLTKEQFKEHYDNPAAGGTGLVCGYQGLETIDIDLKVLQNVPEQKKFWEEYLQFLKDNIFDFESKFVIVKTRNAGFHILYKCKEIAGNTCLAKPKGSKQAVIETRGIGGYVFIYSDFVQGKDYSDIKEITVTERDIIFGISKYYDYKEETPEPEKMPVKEYEVGITPWRDYNEKTRIWDLVSSEFTIVRRLNEMTIIRRNGATSPHSGYIYSNNRMYLFSTGTRYDAEKLLSPFAIYAIQNHYGDFHNAAKQLYRDGYGTRSKPREQPKTQKATEPPPKKENTATFPIDVFPEEIQYYFNQLTETLSASTDYLGCSFLWALSLCVGNSVKIEIKRGWIEAATVWIALVGKTGVGKTPSINTIISPLKLRNSIEAKIYNNEREKYDEYLKSEDKNKKSQHEKMKEPKRKTFIHDDITIESLLECHAANLNAIGIFRDELGGWVKDMNKYRAGSDLETWLSCWSNSSMSQSRKTAKSYYVSNGYIPVLGGIQPSILSSHFTPENKENGFVDRILLCFPELEVEYFNENEISCGLLKWYDDYIVGLFDLVKRDFFQLDEYDRVASKIVRFSVESKKEWIRIFRKITDMQRSDEESEYMKSFLPKQKSYIARFAVLLNVLNSYNHGDEFDEITMRSILGAEKLSDYFISMARKVKIDSIETNEMKEMVKISGKVTSKDKFQAVYIADKNINRQKAADQFNVSKMTIQRWIKEIK